MRFQVRRKDLSTLFLYIKQMPNLKVTLEVDGDKFVVENGKEEETGQEKKTRVYGKLEVHVEKGTDPPIRVSAQDIDIGNDQLENANLLLIRTKDGKYLGDLKCRVNYTGGGWKDIPMDSAKILWFNTLPDPKTFVSNFNQIKDLTFTLKDPEKDGECVAICETTVEIVVLRTIPCQVATVAAT
jgi:hypothetical protein